MNIAVKILCTVWTHYSKFKALRYLSQSEPDTLEEKETKKPAVLRSTEEAKPQVKEQHEHKKSAKSEKSKKNQSAETATPAGAIPPPIQNKPVKMVQEKQPSSKSGKKKNEEAHKARLEDDVDGSSTSSQIMTEDPVKEQPFQQTEVVVVKQAPKPSKKKRSEITTLHQLSK